MLNEQQIKQMQKSAFGSRYMGAALAASKHPHGISDKIMRYIANPRGSLVIYGPPGTGKTYLCAALIDYLRCSASLRAYSWRKLLADLRLGFSEQGGDWEVALRYKMDDEIVIVDDVGSDINSPWQEAVLTSVLDERNTGLIMTTNFTRKDFAEKFNPRVVSRVFSVENTLVDMSQVDDKRTQVETFTERTLSELEQKERRILTNLTNSDEAKSFMRMWSSRVVCMQEDKETARKWLHVYNSGLKSWLGNGAVLHLDDREFSSKLQRLDAWLKERIGYIEGYTMEHDQAPN